MRILEQCVSAWPMPEVEAQINALRVAFSANIDKPFELKPSFPYGSPSESYHPSPPLESQYTHLHPPSNQNFDQQSQYSHPAQTLLTPPISAGAGDSRTESPSYHPPYLPPLYNQQQPPSTMHQQQQPVVIPENLQWNPTPIIDQWNTAFAIPPSAMAPPSHTSVSPSSNMPSLSQHPSVSPPQVPQGPQSYAASYSHAMVQPVAAPQPHQQHYVQQYQPPIPQTQPGYVQDPPVFITPRDWQQSVASVFDPVGMKRRWGDYNGQDTGDYAQKRVR